MGDDPNGESDKRRGLPRVDWDEEETSDGGDLWHEVTPAGAGGAAREEASPGTRAHERDLEQAKRAASQRRAKGHSRSEAEASWPEPVEEAITAAREQAPLAVRTGCPPAGRPGWLTAGPCASPPPGSPRHKARDVLEQPFVVSRRPMKRAGPPAEPKATRAILPPTRRYPKMLALLSRGEEVPLGSAPVPSPEPSPVPGTFFPAPRAPIERPAPPEDLDHLLATMAEGLLIGENDAGATEVRITLKDEFFAGTELRITVCAGEVAALLVPPDRAIYWQLQASLSELEDRLAARGLRVREIRVAEP